MDSETDRVGLRDSGRNRVGFGGLESDPERSRVGPTKWRHSTLDKRQEQKKGQRWADSEIQIVIFNRRQKMEDQKR